MGEEEIFQRCIGNRLLISRKRARRRMNRVAIRKQRSVQHDKSGMRQVSFIAIDQQSHLECCVSDCPNALTVVTSILSIYAEIISALIKCNVSLTGKLPLI